MWWVVCVGVHLHPDRAVLPLPDDYRGTIEIGRGYVHRIDSGHAVGAH